MKNVIIAGRPVWVEEDVLEALQDGLRLRFEEVEGKSMPDFQDLCMSVQCGQEPIRFLKLYADTHHLRSVSQWLSRIGGKVYIERPDAVLLCYEHGRVGPPFNTPYPQDIDTYTKL